MRVLPLALIGEPILRTRAEDVPVQDIQAPAFQAFIDDLIHTMRAANGAGLAAPQVFRAQRVCVLEVANNPRYPYKPAIPLTVLINPQLTPVGDDTFDNYEGCLSVPNLRGVVQRHARLRVQALDRHGAPLNFETAGITAGTYQHEVDHLNGCLYVDRVRDPTTLCTWDAFVRYHEASFRETVANVVARYGS